MFVGVARLTLQIPESGSLKDKRQILRKVTDRLKARFNVSVAEVADNDLWQKATIGLCVVGNSSAHVNEQMDKCLRFVEEMYVAPVISRELEMLNFGSHFGATQSVPGVRPDHDTDLAGLAEDGEPPSFEIPKGDRSLAEAEGIAWEDRHEEGPPGLAAEAAARTARKKAGEALTDEDRRARARALRNPREWEQPSGAHKGGNKGGNKGENGNGGKR